MDIHPDITALEALRELATVQPCSNSSSATTNCPERNRHWRREAIEMASRLRQLTRGMNVLFHGTPAWRAILRENMLSADKPGIPAISFSRDPSVAAYWACLPREEPSEPGVLVLNRASLIARYSVTPFDYWGEVRHLGWDMKMAEEAEEHVYGRDVDDLHRHLVGMLYLAGVEPCGDRMLFWREK
jgi:hypothetical protein